MKKYLLLFSLTASLTACSLEETLYNNPNSETFINNENDVAFQLSGVYNFFTQFGGYAANLTYPILYGGDDIATTGAAQRLFADKSLPASNQYHTGWGIYYNTINNANALMEVVERTDKVSEAFRQRVLGELRFMRGFSYFNLVRFYGGVPIKAVSTTGGSEFYQARNSVDEVYAFLLEDLKKASELCLPFSKQPGPEFGRATKGAAQAVYALASLTYANQLDLADKSGEAQAHYLQAKSYADSVILSGEYALIPDYADLWDINKEKGAYREVIYGIQFTRDALAASASSRGSELAYYTQPSTRNNVCGNVTDGLGAGTLRIQPWFYDYCTTGDFENDYRAEVSFTTTWLNTITGVTRITYPLVRTTNETVEAYPYIDKYKDPDGYQARNNENDLFITRLAEVYLIKAEAENELNGPTEEAYAAFNKLRERARLADGNARETPLNLAAGLTKEEFRRKIFDERGLELVGEGHRWFDLVRMRYQQTNKTMMEHQYADFLPTLLPHTAPTYVSASKTWTGGRVQPLNIVPFHKKFLIWPIPSSEIDANPAMTQNENW